MSYPQGHSLPDWLTPLTDADLIAYAAKHGGLNEHLQAALNVDHEGTGRPE